MNKIIFKPSPLKPSNAGNKLNGEKPQNVQFGCSSDGRAHFAGKSKLNVLG